MIKNSNGKIISEKEKLQLENEELIIEDIKSNKCQGKTTQKIKRNKKKIKELEETALDKGEGADDTIEKTDPFIQ